MGTDWGQGTALWQVQLFQSVPAWTWAAPEQEGGDGAVYLRQSRPMGSVTSWLEVSGGGVGGEGEMDSGRENPGFWLRDRDGDRTSKAGMVDMPGNLLTPP